VNVLQLVTTPRPFFDQQVAALERRGVSCTTLAVPRPPEGGRSLRDFARFLPRVLARGLDDYDLVHANHGLVAPFALAQPTRPVVVTFWGTDLMGDRTPAHRAIRWTSRRAAALADAVILPSPAMRRYVDAETTLVPFGVDTDLFRPEPRDVARERLGWPPAERVVLFPYDPGRTVKDYPRAERVVARVDAESDSSVPLRAVSGVSHDEMPTYLNASDALLVTSRRESGPMVVREALACDLPVVSTDVGFVRETVEGVENAAVCGTDRELVAALGRVLAGDRRSDGRDAVTGLGLDAMGDAILSVYERVLDGPGAGDSRAAGRPRSDGRVTGE